MIEQKRQEETGHRDAKVKNSLSELCKSSYSSQVQPVHEGIASFAWPDSNNVPLMIAVYKVQVHSLHDQHGFRTNTGDQPVIIRSVDAQDQCALQQLELLPQQQSFVSPIAETLRQLLPTWHPYLLEVDRHIVGFLVLDTNYQLAELPANEVFIGIRSFIIDAKQQGQGYAKAALDRLDDFVARFYPYAHSLALTVNCQNTVAYHCYLKAGFSDTGDLYLGGKAGPQHVMRRALQHSECPCKHADLTDNKEPLVE